MSKDKLHRFLVSQLAVLAVLFVSQRCVAQGRRNSSLEPWDKSAIVTPEDLAKQLTRSEGVKPLVVCVGFEFLYKSAHVPTTRFIGPAKETKGLDELKNWARDIPPDRDVVIYCGCCPMKQCPNIRPAYQALREMRPAHLKVLFLETSFAKDWVEKGYPVEKGGNGK